jgi:chemotaxis protein histidine kinase CheA
MADINIKAQLQVDTGNSAQSIGKTQDALKGASTQTKDAGNSFGKLKGELGALSPALGQASQGVGALTQAFNILKANPIIGVFALLAGLVVALFQKFKQMEGVSDALGKAFGTLSGVFNTFITGFLTPLIDGFVWLIENVSGGLISVLSALGVTTEQTAQRFGEITEALDDLEDAQRNSAIATAEANRRLQDAREIAADANLPIRDRIAALKEAARIEREESQKVIEINQMKARLTMEAMAMELGARGDLIAKIREGSIEQLKAARLELQNMKNVDKDKLSAIDNMIIAAENEAASMAKIAKKTQSQITSIEKEESDKRIAKRKEEADKKKAIAEQEERDRLALVKIQYETQKEISDNNIKLAQQQTQKEKADLEAENAEFQKRMDAETEAENKAYDAAQKKKNDAAKLEKDQADAVLLYEQQKRDTYKMTGETLGALGDLVGKQTIAGKALAISQALINTYLGVTEVLRNKTVIPEPFGTIQKVASVATILASGFSAVRNIGRTQVPGGGGGATPTMASVAAPVAPQSTATSLSASTIQNIGNAAAGGVNRAYVLDSDIRNSDERNVRLQRAARLG